MSDKKAVLFIISGLIVILCLSVFLVLNKNTDEEIVPVIIIETSLQTETIKEPDTETEIIIKTTCITSTSEKSVEVIKETEAAEKFIYININTADSDDLKKLDGIGDVLAGRIITYRNNYGEFKNIEEIMFVNGIGEKIFYNICDHIYVENPTYEETSEYIEVYETINEIEETPEESTVTEQIISEEITSELLTTVTEYIKTLDEVAPININTAELDELMLLPYVTEEIAIQIIELRDSINGYSHPYELLYIDELEQNQVAEIVNFVTVGQLT